METEVSLLCSQNPTTGPYSEPDGSSPRPLSLISILLLFPHLHLSLVYCLFPLDFPNKIL
jgi:hypothetical protein